jgi:hypothetical protein
MTDGPPELPSGNDTEGATRRPFPGTEPYEGVKVGGDGSLYEYPVEVIEEEPEPVGGYWPLHCVFLTIAAAAAAVGIYLCWRVYQSISRSAHVSVQASGQTGQFHRAGYAFALVTIVVVCFLAIRWVARFLSGSD